MKVEEFSHTDDDISKGTITRIRLRGLTLAQSLQLLELLEHSMTSRGGDFSVLNTAPALTEAPAARPAAPEASDSTEKPHRGPGRPRKERPATEAAPETPKAPAEATPAQASAPVAAPAAPLERASNGDLPPAIPLSNEQPYVLATAAEQKAPAPTQAQAEPAPKATAAYVSQCSPEAQAEMFGAEKFRHVFEILLKQPHVNSRKVVRDEIFALRDKIKCLQGVTDLEARVKGSFQFIGKDLPEA